MTQQPQRNLEWECKACGLNCVVYSAGYHNAPTCGCLHNSDIGAIWTSHPTPAAPEFQNVKLGDWIEGVGDITTEYERQFVERYGTSATQAREKVLDIFAEVEYLHDVDGITYPDLYNEFIQRYKSLRTQERPK